MANHYFQFKQFTVQQEHCAMKVCTDACLFGAWLAEQMVGSQKKIARCLDIGAGTGLLSLIIAQKLGEVTIDAVEIDEQAAHQADENFRHSPWADRMQIHVSAVQQFKPPQAYGLVVSNPPFFENDLKSPQKKRNLALHSEALNLSDLLEASRSLLQQAGFFGVLLAFHRMEECEILARKHTFFLYKKMLVKQSPVHPPFRVMMIFSTSAAFPVETGYISIKDSDGSYHPEFKKLLQDYYLNL